MYQLLLKKYYPFLIIILLVISNIVTYCYYGKKEKTTVECSPSNIVAPDSENINIMVDIKGEVKKPGLYQIALGSNLNDLIKLAGGLTKNGTTSNINLARKLTDQSVVVIKSKKQSSSKIVEIPCVCPELEITKCDSSIIEISTSEKLEGEKNKTVTEIDANKKVSINRASKEELMTLSGIGESKADAIIAYRNQNGLFTKLEDLINVSGISENIFNKIKDNIEL